MQPPFLYFIYSLETTNLSAVKDLFKIFMNRTIVTAWAVFIVIKHITECRPRWSSGYHTRLWIRGSWIRQWIFSERKILEYDFLQKRSKVMGAVL